MLSGPLTQTCWVVPDVDAAEKGLTTLFGVRRWTRLEGIDFPAATTTYRGAPTALTAHVSLAYLGDMQLELIQPVAGTSVHTEFLDRVPNGGLHHVCVEVDDLDAALESAPWPVAQTGSMADGAVRFAYLDGAAFGAPYVELAQIGPAIRAFYDQLKEQHQ